MSKAWKTIDHNILIATSHWTMKTNLNVWSWQLLCNSATTRYHIARLITLEMNRKSAILMTAGLFNFPQNLSSLNRWLLTATVKQFLCGSQQSFNETPYILCNRFRSATKQNVSIDLCQTIFLGCLSCHAIEQKRVQKSCQKFQNNCDRI